MILLKLIHNLLFLIALSIVSGFLDKRFPRNKLSGLSVQGFLFGIVSIIGMMVPFVFNNDLIFDGRSVVISLAALFFGPITGSIAGTMAIIFRWYQGGYGIIPGTLVVISSLIIGSIFHFLKKKNNKELTFSYLLFFGFVVHLAMLLMMFSLPYAIAISVIQQIGIYVIVSYPLATVLIGKILYDQEVNTLNFENIKASEVKFRSIFENNMDAMLLTTHDGKILEANQAACRMFGYTEKELIKLDNTGIVDENGPNLTAMIFNSSSNRNELGELTFIKKDGSHFNAEISTAVFKSQDDSILTCIIIRDITERNENEVKYHYMFANNPQPMIIFDLETLFFLEANKAAIEHYGYTREEFLSMTIKQIRPDEDNEALVRDLEKTRYSYNPGGEWRHKKKNGEIINVEIISTSILYNGRKARHVMINDITKRKKTEESLLKLSLAVEQSPASVMITNCLGDIEYVNEKFCQISGYSKDDVIGKKQSITNSDLQDIRFFEDIWNTIQTGNEWKGELLNKKKNGDLIWESTLISPLINEKGNLTHFIVVKEDITERKRAEKEIIEAKNNAEEMNRLKTNFLANMSHELRTPLIGILGYAEFLENELKDEELLQMVRTIKSSGKRLNTTLNNILDISKIEAGKQKINLREHDLIKCLSEQIELFKAAAEGKNLSLNFETEEKTLHANIDEEMFLSIISNLLNNAIKFTNKGKVTVRAAKQKNNAIIEVEDTGIGVSENFQKTIFEPFRQASEGFSRKFEGTGLGLALVNKYAVLMNGTITMKSKPEDLTAGKTSGSIFKLKIPLSNNGY